jgi:hypothetical protein
MKTRVMPQATEKTIELYNEIKTTKQGAVASYAFLETKCGINVTAQPGYGYLRTARRMAQRDNQIQFEVVKGVGIKRMTANDVAGYVLPETTRRVNKLTTRQRNKLATITQKEYAALPSERKLSHDMALSLIGAIRHDIRVGSRPKKEKKAVAQSNLKSAAEELINSAKI